MARSKQRRGPKPGSSRARRRRNDIGAVYAAEVGRKGRVKRAHVKIVTGAGGAGVAQRDGLGVALTADAREGGRVRADQHLNLDSARGLGGGVKHAGGGRDHKVRPTTREERRAASRRIRDGGSH